MAVVNLSEKDFEALGAAANLADRAADDDLARRLDMIARKLNAAISNQKMSGLRRHLGGPGCAPLSWKDVPSTRVTELLRGNEINP